jgi:hypothetical protein
MDNGIHVGPQTLKASRTAQSSPAGTRRLLPPGSPNLSHALHTVSLGVVAHGPTRKPRPTAAAYNYGPTSTLTSTVNERDNIVRAGLNYKFW